MERDQLEAAAKRAGLDKLLQAFPEEVAATMALADEQRAALLAMPLDPDDAP